MNIYKIYQLGEYVQTDLEMLKVQNFISGTFVRKVIDCKVGVLNSAFSFHSHERMMYRGKILGLINLVKMKRKMSFGDGMWLALSIWATSVFNCEYWDQIPLIYLIMDPSRVSVLATRFRNEYIFNKIYDQLDEICDQDPILSKLVLQDMLFEACVTKWAPVLKLLMADYPDLLCISCGQSCDKHGPRIANIPENPENP